MLSPQEVQEKTLEVSYPIVFLFYFPYQKKLNRKELQQDMEVKPEMELQNCYLLCMIFLSPQEVMKQIPLKLTSMKT